MLKFFMIRHPDYKHIENKELVYEAFKWEHALPMFISACKMLIYTYAYYIPLMLLVNKYKILENILILLILVPFIILYRRGKRMRNPLYPNIIEEFLERNIRRYFATPKGNALSKDDFKVIKKQKPIFYREITSDYCGCKCHSYARDIALFFLDAKLIYCAATNPFEPAEVFAHAVLERNGEIYDTNRRMSYKIEEYEEIFKVQLYKKWTYDEFSKADFQERVREDFWIWCKENGVGSYHLF